MNPRRINLMLWTAAGALAAAGLGALVLAWTLPAEVEAPDVPRAARPATAASQVSPAGTLVSYQALIKRDWRRPLTEMGPAEAEGPGAPPVAAAAPVTLVGTIGQSLAILRTASGETEVRGPGESIGNVKVLAVRTSEVDVEIAGRRATLVRPKD